MPEASEQNSSPPASVADPAATDETSDNARKGAKKRRDPDEPRAVVGLGASAGGVSVLQQFFAEMPAESGMAFVVVMHLSPEHESNLTAVLQQKTSMPVTQVSGPVKVRPNQVYVIPPNNQLIFEESTLRLVEPQQPKGPRVTIDLFFRTLAQAYGQRAVCVVFSGTASDGAIGLKHIRAQGGVTIAQDPNEAEHDSMPVTAISTGMVDWVLPVAAMPGKLMEFIRNEARMKLPPEIPEAEEPHAKEKEAPGGETISEVTREARDEEALGQVLADLRAQTGHDFSHYKRATILRRIARRLQVNSIESVPDYVEFLRKHSAEGRALLQDLLIGVTHFFRDREAFAALAANIPQLFAGKKKDDFIRVWVAGCATGEEAYSIAILLCEYAARLERPPAIQIFASDVDEQAIADARDGLYPSTIEADVSPERLAEFFANDHGRYRVRKELREKVLFAAHNVLQDAPFSHVDLVSCRNLLIYLNAEAQEQVFDIFHFALVSGGLLFIGGAENNNRANSLFSPVDAKHRLYVRRSVPRPSWKVPILPLRAPAIHAAGATRGTRLRALPALTPAVMEKAATDPADSLHSGQARREVLFGELHLKLLERYGPPSVVIDERHDIVHLSEHAGRYLQFVPGEVTSNLSKVVLPALRVELRTALFKAEQTHESARGAPQTVEIEGRVEVVSVVVRPMPEQQDGAGFHLVLFERQADLAPAPVAPADAEDLHGELDKEIQYLKEQLNHTVDQYEASGEELRASNEELQAMNEELRSATEELETSKEELQSVNEELTTVNQELKSNVEELSRTNADLNNLMASTDIGTIFLDRELRIQRFTPSAQKIFNFIPADLGRPLSDITHKLAYESFISDAEQVLRDLTIVEREVRVGEETWYLTRIAPYRTGEDRIAGLVATFVDITRRKRAEDELRELAQRTEAELRRFNTIMASVPDLVYQFDLEGRFSYISQSLLDLWRLTNEQAIGRNFHELDYPPELATKLQAQIQEVVQTRRPLKDTTPYTSAIGARHYEYLFFPLLGDDGETKGVGGVTRDITDRMEAAQALRQSEERFRQFADNSSDVFWIVDVKTRRLEYLNPAFEEMWGAPRETILDTVDGWLDLIHPDDHALARSNFPKVLAGRTHTIEYRIIRPHDGEVRLIRDTSFPIRDEKGAVFRIAGVGQDVTEERQRSEALAESEERFRLLVEGARDYAIFMVDPSNIIVHWNDGAERIFGWSAEEAIGQSGELIFTPEDRAIEREETEIEIALRDGTASDCRWHLRKDGSRVWVDGVMTRLDDEENGALRGFAKIARDATAQRRAREELEERVAQRTAELTAINKTLQSEIEQRGFLEQEILLISEREKRRIGQDLHDSLCQELAGAAFLLQASAERFGKRTPAAAKALTDAAKIVNDNVGLARDLARGLHPVELSTSGLTTALSELAFRTHDGVECRFECPKPVRITDDAMALNLYRIAQEAVANALKHAKPRAIVIRLERKRTGLVLTVEDDGTGIVTEAKTKGMGLHIMRYRANVIGATCTVRPREPRGTCVHCILPRLKKQTHA